MHETQESVGSWMGPIFSDLLGPKSRSIAVVEEACELALASGVTAEEILAAVKVPIQKNAERGNNGDPEEELADVYISMYAYAADSRMSAQSALDRKMSINRLRPTEYYLRKNKEKFRLGMPGPSAEPTSAPVVGKDAV